MKDPLQTGKTPYEVLGISTDASKEDIISASKAALSSGGNIKEKMEARGILMKPATRAFADIFLYNDKFLKQMAPPINDINKLITGRGLIVKSWENIGKKLFPNYPSIHSLAVACYWEAVYEEEVKFAERSGMGFKKIAGVPEHRVLKTLWENVIAYWTAIIADDGFWNLWIKQQGAMADMTSEDVEALRKSIENHFHILFENYMERCRNQEDKKSVTKYEEYLMLFTSELNIAKQLQKVKAGVLRNGTPIGICYGKLMLDKMELLDDVRTDLERQRQMELNNAAIETLITQLSPYSHISLLIDNKKYDNAISKIKALPQQVQDKLEVRRLLCRAYLEKGKQCFGMDKFDDAIECWKLALLAGNEAYEINKVFVGICKTKAVDIKKGDPDAAMMLLEKALKVTNDNELSIILSDLLTDKGIQIVLKAQNDAKEEECSNKIIESIEKGIDYLERAAALGNSKAAENLAVAKQILQDALDGFIVLREETMNMLAEARRELEMGAYDRAIEIIEIALNRAGNAEKKYIIKALAQSLNQRAVKNINFVTAYIQSSMDSITDKEIDKKIRSLIRHESLLMKIVYFIFYSCGFIPLYYLTMFIMTKVFGLKANSVGTNFAVIGVDLLIILIIIFGGNRKNNSPYQRCQAKHCKNDAHYKIDLEKYGEVYLCYTHSDELEKILNPVPVISPMMKECLNSARRDLQRVISLDPSFKQAKENMDVLNAVTSKFNI